MNVIFTIRYFYPFIGGTEKQALTLASHLAEKGVDVTILTSRFQRSWQCRECMGDVKVVRLCSPRIKVIVALIFLTCLVCYLIRERRNYSIIHTFQISYTASLSILLGIILKKPAILKLASSGSGGDIKKAKKTLWGRMFLYLAKKASCIITVNSKQEQELLAEQVSPARIFRIGNGVDLALHYPCKDKSEIRKRVKVPEKKTIIYTGRLSLEKGVDFLIRSFSKINKEIRCQLIIIADGSERKTILSLINKHELNDSVLFLDHAKDVAPYLNASDLFILPSRFEGLSNALLEAMASGLAVISTKVGGSTDIIQDGVNGLLIDVDSEEQMVHGMLRIIKDAQLANALGESARKTMEDHYDISRIAHSYLSLYKQL